MGGMDEDSADSGAEMTAESADVAEDGAATSAVPSGPAVVDEGRTLSGEDEVRALVDDPRVRAVADLSLDADAARNLAAIYTEAMRGQGEQRTVVGEVESADLAAVGACVTELVAGDATIIPAYAELITYADEPAIVYGLVSADPASGRHERVELWVVSREGCEVRLFTQP
jgi:hypothetical protein